jgi:hypothetical protein
MALFTTLAALSQTPGSNAPDGSVDAPSTIDDQMRSLASFIAIERDGGHQWGSSVGGTANAITITVNGISSLVAGQTFKFVAPSANTGAVTLNVNSLGAKNVNKNGTTALAAGDIAALSTVTVTYDGTNFQVVNPAVYPLGYSQTWQNVTASRALGTTYTNTTSAPIGVAVSYTVTAPTTAQPVIGGITVPCGGGINAATLLTANFIVPPGTTYSLPNLNFASGLYWVELR